MIVNAASWPSCASCTRRRSLCVRRMAAERSGVTNTTLTSCQRTLQATLTLRRDSVVAAGVAQQVDCRGHGLGDAHRLQQARDLEQVLDVRLQTGEGEACTTLFLASLDRLQEPEP